MAKNSPSSGSDAAYIEPKLIPDYELQGRDDSGGPDYAPYSAVFGDGDYKVGAKAHLSARGGSDDSMGNDMQESTINARKRVPGKGPASSRTMAGR